MAEPVRFSDVPREFLGKARLFCSHIEGMTHDARAATKHLLESAQGIAKRRRKWRPEHLAEFERQWRHTIPAGCRVRLDVARNKHGLAIEDVRLAYANYEDRRWLDPSMAISVAVARYHFQLTEPAVVSYRRHALALFGIHALARRYQRGADGTDEAVFADISELIAQGDALAEKGPAFSLACRSGRWVGALETVEVPNRPMERLLHVRSFLPAE